MFSEAINCYDEALKVDPIQEHLEKQGNRPQKNREIRRGNFMPRKNNLKSLLMIIKFNREKPIGKNY
jgi:hypothetical protein